MRFNLILVLPLLPKSRYREREEEGRARQSAKKIAREFAACLVGSAALSLSAAGCYNKTFRGNLFHHFASLSDLKKIL